MVGRWCLVAGAFLAGSAARCEEDLWLSEVMEEVSRPVVDFTELPKVTLRLDEKVSNLSRALYILPWRRSRTSEAAPASTASALVELWRQLPPLAVLAVRGTEHFELLKRLLFATQERSHSQVDLDVQEFACTACGCLALRGATGVKTGGRGRLWRWQRRVAGRMKQLGEACKTDKVWRHSYHLIYDRVLPETLEPGSCFLEIGYGCGMSYDVGASARLWAELYPQTQVHMVDHNKACVQNMGQDFLNRQNYTVHIADQSSIKDLERLKDDLYDGCSGQLSVIIDDGSHQSQDIITSFLSLYPMLGSKGLYFIEDLGSSAYRSMYRDSALAGQEAPGNSLYFMASLLRHLLRKGSTPERTAYPQLRALQCRRNMCVVKNW
ncbi:unnamed protein product [Durusdinium trenchii]|uniref:Uncharacterized protein n=1 Tax=Durusdinium trenchii TaxID=1381693 RepID=A0ABP0NWH9_9DINO